MRDKLIYFYFGVDVALVWQTLMNKLPDIKQRLQLILRE